MAEEVRFIFSMEDRFTEAAQRAEAQAGILEQGLGRIGTAVAGAFSVGAIVSFEKSVIDSYSRFEQFQASLTTMFHGNQAEARLLGDQLQQFAQTTPFELTEIQEATKMMLAYGSTSGGVVKEMRMLGDISSGVGAPLKDIAYLYGTLRTQGRAYAMDIRQFAGRGIPIIDALAKHFKVGKEEVMKLVEKGKVGFPEVEKALKSLTEQGGQFAGMMEMQSRTLGGQISNLGDSWDRLKVNIGESQSGILKSTTAFLTQLTSDIADFYADQNKLENAFKRGGAKQFGWYERRTDDEYLAYQQTQRGYGEELQKAADNRAKLFGIIQQASEGLVGLHKRFRSGQIDYDTYLRMKALSEERRENAQTRIKQLDDAKKAQKETEAATKGKEKQSHHAKSQQYTNITINIDKQIEDVTFNTTNVKESANDMANQLLKALTAAVVDAQIIAGTK